VFGLCNEKLKLDGELNEIGSGLGKSGFPLSKANPGKE